MVCGQEIGASTAQLVSASRVKADPRSANKSKLESDSVAGIAQNRAQTNLRREVQSATKSLIEAVRNACLEKRDARTGNNLYIFSTWTRVFLAQDFMKLTLTQAKRLQMDSQVFLFSFTV